MNSTSEIKGRRIIFCLSSIGGGGAERVASLLCNHWVEQGASVMIVATASRFVDNGYFLHDDITVIHLAECVHGGRSKIKRVLAMRSVFRSYKPDAIVSFITDVNIASIIGSFGIGCPVIVSERSYPPARLADTGKLNVVLRRLLYRYATCVVAQTCEAAAWLTANCPGSRVEVIPNPVGYPVHGGNILDAKYRELIEGRRVILAAGRLVSSKRFDIAIHAFARIASSITDAVLIVLGDGPERARLVSLSVQLGVEKRVFFLGHVNNPGAWYCRSSVYVFPSSFEGFPNAVMEAMSYGVPVVCFDILAGLKQVVSDGENGVMLPDNNHVERMAEAVRQLLEDSGMRIAMGARSTAVRSIFSIENASKKWLRLMYSE